jgi:hypothetical protein
LLGLPLALATDYNPDLLHLEIVTGPPALNENDSEEAINAAHRAYAMGISDTWKKHHQSANTC